MTELEEYNVTVSVEQAADGTIMVAAQVVEMPSCVVQGKTAAEAWQRLSALFPGYVAQLQKLGVPIPAPRERVARVQGGQFYQTPVNMRPAIAV